MTCNLICDKCGYVISREDDYGGMYVFDNDKHYHYGCHQDILQESSIELLKLMEDK